MAGTTIASTMMTGTTIVSTGAYMYPNEAKLRTLIATYSWRSVRSDLRTLAIVGQGSTILSRYIQGNVM
jgi:hypothetical protein